MFRIRSFCRILVLACLAGTAGFPGSATAQDAKVPDAADLIDRYVDLLGGRDAVLAPRSVRIRSVVEMPGLGAEGEMEVITSGQGEMVFEMTLPGLGEMRSGFTEGVGWAMDGMTGPRLMEGAELDGVRDQANPLAQVRDASLFDARETVERTEMGGEPCYLVRFVWESGRESFDCYHVETGLVVATIETSESPTGSFEITTLIEEYDEVEGILFPVRTAQEVMGQRIHARVVEVVFDDVEPSDLDPPAAVRTLIESRRSER